MTGGSRSFLLLAMVALSAPGRPARAAGPNPATWRGDPQFLVAAVDSIHPRPYRWARRTAWDSAAAALDERLPSLRYDQAVAGFSRLLGLLKDGHSRLDQVQLPSHGAPMLSPLPGPGFDAAYAVECGIFSDGLWIVRSGSAHADLLGAHVLAIAGQPVAQAVAALTPFIPADNSMWALNVLPAVLRSPGYLAAAGLNHGPADPLRLEVMDSHGRRREARIAAVHDDSASTWVWADANIGAPLPLTRSLPGPFSFADLDDSTVFARIRQIADLPGHETMAQFAARLFSHVDSLGARRLILDLRGNGGGNNYLNQPLVHAVIRHPAIDRDGHLFVIVDRGTFSAAVSLAADLERETHPVFVGEPTGGAPDSPGDPAHVTLPASGLVVRISTVLWQGSDPRDPREFIAPDLPAMPAWSDWLAHRDPAVAAIRAFHPAGPESDAPPNTHWGSPRKLEARPPHIAW